MSLTTFVDRWYLQIGWMMLSLGWASPLFSDSWWTILLVAVSVALIVNRLIAHGFSAARRTGFRDWQIGLKVLLCVATLTLISTAIGHYYLGWIEDIGGLVITVGAVFQLVALRSSQATERQT